MKCSTPARQSLLSVLAGLMVLSSGALADDPASEPAPVPEEKVFLPDMMDGFAHYQYYYLNDPVTGQPLTSRYIEMITVVGEVDPPGVQGDDRVQNLSEDFNSERERNYMNENPGLVQALVTVIVAKSNPADTTVQLWERVIMRVYNNDDKSKATHWIDTVPWEAQPGFWTITPEVVAIGEWNKIQKN
jgi:hypothetical protein